MSKRIARCIIALSLAIVLAIPLSMVGSVFTKEKEPTTISFEENFRPEGEALSLELPDPEDPEAVNAFVANLYDIACANYQKAENAAFAVKSSTLMLGVIDVPGYRYCVKNGDEYRYLEYSFVDSDNDNPVLAMLSVIAGAVASDSTKFALSQYTDGTMDKMVARRAVVGKNADHVTRTMSEDGSVTFDVDWSGVTQEEVEKPIYCASQAGEFRHTDHTVNTQTIRNAVVEYNAEGGYYVCKFELDPEVAPLEKTLPSLKANSGKDSAHYTSLVQEMHVWDNGYFKFFRAIDKWEADALSSVIDFHTTYYFDSAHTDITNYQYMAEMCRK